MSIRMDVRNLNEEANLRRIIQNPNPLEGDNKKFTEDGIFSPTIFGNMASGIEWSCTCGALHGEFHKGEICEEEDCGSEVTFRGLMLDKEGWIDLEYPCIHPLFYIYLQKIIGASVLSNIINYKGDIKVEGQLIEPPLKEPFTGIGIIRFMDNFETVMNYFLKKKKKQKEYDFVMEHIEQVFIYYYPIINVRLRPAIVVDGEFSFEEINNYYNILIKNSNILRDLSSMEQNDLNILPLLYNNQLALNNIYTNIVDNLSEKDGYIRSTLIGNRFNFSSRMVITPLTGEYEMDEFTIPYNAALELMRPFVIRKIRTLHKTTFMKANEIFYKATLKFNETVYNIVNEIITSKNVKFIINRNPSINIGSVMIIKCAGVKRDKHDLTASIHNLILSSLGADYDGDVLNFIAIFSKEYCELFKPLYVHNMMIDADTGLFNRDFLPAKDTLLGLETLFTN